jgi:intracellular multiplication protein IcmB
VAPTGSATSNRQAEMMSLLRRRILGRNFFLRRDCVHHVPEAVRCVSAWKSDPLKLGIGVQN